MDQVRVWTANKSSVRPVSGRESAAAEPTGARDRRLPQAQAPGVQGPRAKNIEVSSGAHFVNVNLFKQKFLFLDLFFTFRNNVYQRSLAESSPVLNF